MNKIKYGGLVIAYEEISHEDWFKKSELPKKLQETLEAFKK